MRRDLEHPCKEEEEEVGGIRVEVEEEGTRETEREVEEEAEGIKETEREVEEEDIKVEEEDEDIREIEKEVEEEEVEEKEEEEEVLVLGPTNNSAVVRDRFFKRVGVAKVKVKVKDKVSLLLDVWIIRLCLYKLYPIWHNISFLFA